MMNATLPNLELLLYQAQTILPKDAEFMEKMNKIVEKNGKYVRPEFNVVCFPQMWGSTCTGFDVCPDGSPAFGGQMMTKAYTTVIEETLTETYVVFFNNKPAYCVTNANEQFLTDLKNHKLAPLSVARRKY